VLGLFFLCSIFVKLGAQYIIKDRVYFETNNDSKICSALNRKFKYPMIEREAADQFLIQSTEKKPNRFISPFVICFCKQFFSTHGSSEKIAKTMFKTSNNEQV
jgi:hypothetical protein